MIYYRFSKDDLQVYLQTSKSYLELLKSFHILNRCKNYKLNYTIDNLYSSLK